MSTVKNNTNPNGVSDMLGEFTADAPDSAKARGGTRSPFTPDPTVLAKISEALTSQGAITGSKGYSDEKAANKAGATFRKYASFVADSYGRGLGVRTSLRDSDNLWHWKYQLTTKRVAKPKAE